MTTIAALSARLSVRAGAPTLAATSTLRPLSARLVLRAGAPTVATPPSAFPGIATIAVTNAYTATVTATGAYTATITVIPPNGGDQLLPGDLLNITGMFATVAGVATTPTTIAATVRDPNGNVTDLTLSNPQTGEETATYTPQIAGAHIVEMKAGPGGVQVGAWKQFDVDPWPY